MAETKEGGIVIGGYTNSEETGDDMMFIRTNQKGEKLWIKTMGTENRDIISDIIITRENEIAAVGIRNKRSLYAIKMKDPYSGIEIAETVEELLSISPNPAKDYFIIKNRGKSSEYRITTGLGELVKTGEILEGNNKIDLEGFASGVYYIRFKNSLEVKKIVVVK